VRVFFLIWAAARAPCAVAAGAARLIRQLALPCLALPVLNVMVVALGGGEPTTKQAR